MPSIYTRSGDSGTTCLYPGTHVNKADKLVSLLGEIDELVVRIGSLRLKHDQQELESIQSQLMSLMSWIAIPEKGHHNEKQKKVKLYRPNVQDIEISIDSRTNTLKLDSFIFPFSKFHLCRTQTRKCERKFWKLFPEEKLWGTYLNRLSDLFFAMAISEEPTSKWRHPAF